MKQFNLVDEPWIPCLRLDGSVEVMGLREALTQSHEIRSLVGDTPPITAVLYRLLLAIVHRVVDGPKNSSEWDRLWSAGKLDSDRVNEYLSQWHERFYLFHPEHPFYHRQSSASKEKPVSVLFPDMASGNNATLFDHSTDAADVALTPSRAARALLFVQIASFAGGSGLAPRNSSDAPWSRGMVFLMEGDTLFETLMLNLLPRDMVKNKAKISPAGTGEDRPVWEADDPFHPLRSAPLGYLDYLTWPTRAIWLIPEEANEGVVVRKVLMGPGLKVETDIRDPFHHYRIDEKRGALVLRFREGRMLWRDSAALLDMASQEKSPPVLFQLIANLIHKNILGWARKYRYMALGMSNNQAKVDFYREEHMPLPGEYLRDHELVNSLREGIENSQKVRDRLMRAVSRMAALILSPTADEGGRRPDPKDVRALMSHWAVERRFWASIEVPFLRFMEDLPADSKKAIEEWNRVLVQSAWESLEQAERFAGDDPRAMKAAVRARGQLGGALKKLSEKLSEKLSLAETR